MVSATLSAQQPPRPLGSDAERAFCWVCVQDTVYHVFSNGGFLFLSAVLLNQKRGLLPPGLLGEPKGIIIDSAPGDITAEMAVRGFGAAAMHTHSEGFGDTFRLGLAAAKATFGAYLNLPPIKKRMQEVRRCPTPRAGESERERSCSLSAKCSSEVLSAHCGGMDTLLPSPRWCVCGS